MTTRTVSETTFPRVTLDGETGTASVQMVTRLIDDATGEQVGSDTYHRHVVPPVTTDPHGLPVDFDDTNEHPDVRRARAGFITADMKARYIELTTEDETTRTR